ncbi:MAG: class I tRNA ligase family protein, partial [Alphaproteobacteria bacterium]|nr:class I tRNA ligase family protein [Alphaproteobacteria bacterium]
ALAVPGRDVKFSQSHVEGYRNFATKLWNAARFAEMNGCAFVSDFNPIQLQVPINQWAVSQVIALSRGVEAALKEYKFNEAAHLLYHFIWGIFCDWYLEFCKSKFATDGDEKTETQQTVAWVLDQILRLLHPFMPFITEALWQNLRPEKGLLMGNLWPETQGVTYLETSQDINWLIQVISQVRSLRTEMNVPPAAFLTLSFYDAGPMTHHRIRDYEDLLLKLARLDHVKVFSEPLSSDDAAGAAQLVIGETTLLIPLTGAINVEAEKERLQKEWGKISVEIKTLEKKLANQEFISRAPQEVIETQSSRLEAARLGILKLGQALSRLREL